MTKQEAAVDGFEPAFEDFLAHQAEWAVAEATRDQEANKRLWVVLFGDGRYALEHQTARAASDGPEAVKSAEPTPQIAFLIEPLQADERDQAHLEDSRFERPIEAMWGAYEHALHTQFSG